MFINIYPNPSKGNFVLQSMSIIESVEVFDIAGNVVYSQPVNFIENNEVKLNLDKLSKGIFFVKAVSSKNCNIQKVVIE